jgi:hypothetical protein
MEKKLNSLPKHIRKQGEQTKVEKKKKSIPVHGKRNEMEQFHTSFLFVHRSSNIIFFN